MGALAEVRPPAALSSTPWGRWAQLGCTSSSGTTCLRPNLVFEIPSCPVLAVACTAWRVFVAAASGADPAWLQAIIRGGDGCGRLVRRGEKRRGGSSCEHDSKAGHASDWRGAGARADLRGPDGAEQGKSRGSRVVGSTESGWLADS